MADTAFVANTARRADHTHVLLITTGSVASIKAPLIVKELLSVSQTMGNLIFRIFVLQTFRPGQYANVLVEVVASKASLEFFKKEDIQAAGARVWTDEDEWTVSNVTLQVDSRSPKFKPKTFAILGGL
jgi:phosphopantothenoylcysteine decarboxylase